MPSRNESHDSRELDERNYGNYRRTDAWHFEKRLSLDTVVSIVSVAVFLGGPILIWGRAMENRVQALELVQDVRQKQETARDLDARDQRISILTRMDKIDEQVTALRIEVGKVVTIIPPIRQAPGARQ